jgi:prefoldin alpha subunit
MIERELEEKIAVYRLLESRLEALLKQRDSIASRMMEMRSVVESIDEIEKTENIIFPMGSDVYAFGKIADKKKVMVAVGAGIIMEKSITEAKEILKKRNEEIENMLKEVQENVEKLTATLEQLGPEIQSGIESQAE